MAKGTGDRHNSEKLGGFKMKTEKEMKVKKISSNRHTLKELSDGILSFLEGNAETSIDSTESIIEMVEKLDWVKTQLLLK